LTLLKSNSHILVMWAILENNKVNRQLKKCPKSILEEYEVWKKVVELSGPQALKKIPGYKDYALKGEWQGARSSYLNRQWRVIYLPNKKEVKIFVLEVNAHDYKKKR
jgi:addiction module RelE/StbE family toxin